MAKVQLRNIGNKFARYQKKLIMNLKQAYLDTDYQVQTNNKTLHIRAEQRNREVDEHLNGYETWAYITAWNPDSQDLTASDNAYRNQQLEAALEKKQFPYFHGQGVPKTDDWQPEASFLVLGISKQAAKAFGKRFEQRAIVWGRRGEVSELIPCLREGFEN